MIEIVREVPRQRRRASCAPPLGMGGVFGSVPRSGGFNPQTGPGFSSLVAWHRPLVSATLHATLRSAGSSPPALTITGGSGKYQIDITCPTGGARGTATLTIAVDGVTTMTAATTAATFAITGTDWTLNCPSATYNTNNTWSSIVTQLNDLTGNGYHLAADSGTASLCPLYKAAPTLGKPGIKFDGATNYLVNAGLETAGGISGTASAFTSYVVATVDNLAGLEVLTGASNHTAGQLQYYSMFMRLSDTSAVINLGDGSLTNAITDADSWATGQSLICEANNTTGNALSIYSCRSDGRERNSSNGVAIGTHTFDRYTMGVLAVGGSLSSFGHVTIYDHLVYNSALSTTTRNAIKAGLKHTWFGL